MEDNQLIMGVFFGYMTINGNVVVQDGAERKWLESKRALFGETDSSVSLNGAWKRNWPSLGVGIIDGSSIYIPYCLSGVTITTHMEFGPFNNGVFRSSDLGTNWRTERVSDLEAWLPSIVRTKNYYYYFAVSLPPMRGQRFDLWFTRKSDDGNSWDGPKVITKTFCDSAPPFLSS